MEPVLEQARAFWGDALDLGPIRFVDSRLARVTGRAFVVHNRVHWPGPVPTATQPHLMSTVIHELAHCWQHQTGRWQLTRGLLEQTLFTLLGRWIAALGAKPLYDPYDYGGPAKLAGAATLVSFRLEAQARIIEHYWVSGAPGVRTICGHLLRDDRRAPTPFARDLARLCQDAGIP